MTLTASRTTQGFEPINNRTGFAPNPRLYELTPNTAFSIGDAVVKTDGLIAKAAANATSVYGVMAQAFTTTTNPSTGGVFGLVYDDPNQIFRCTFADHIDGTATGGTTTTLIDTVNLTADTNDYWNGALVYIYEGPGAGDIRTVSDFDAASDTITVTKPFTATITTSSKYIILGYATGAEDLVLNVGSNIDLKDENTLDANATNASHVGPCHIVAIHPKELTMDVSFAAHHFLNT